MKICQEVFKILSGKQISMYIKGHNSGTLVKMNAYIKFGEILPIGSEGTEQKRNYGVNKGQ